MVVPMVLYLPLELDLPLELAPYWSWINEKFELELGKGEEVVADRSASFEVVQ